MSKISIKQQTDGSDADGFPVIISFDDLDVPKVITVRDPLTPENKAKLEWHFEHYVSYPYLKEVETAQASEIIRQAGENLFMQLFGSDPQIFSRYQQTIQNGFDNLVIEISGSPEFHSLHWEALRDANLSKHLALESLILRKNPNLQNYPADVREMTTINLLIVTSRPAGRRDVGYRTISRPLVELLRNSRLPVKVNILRPATYESLDKHLDEVGKGFYHVVHFDVHGALLSFEDFESIEKEKVGNNNLTFQINRYGRPEIQPYNGKDAFLFFDLYREPEAKDDDGFRADPVRADELVSLLLTHGVPLIILNACQSAKELGEQEEDEQKGVSGYAKETSLGSRLMESGAQMVLAMCYSVTVTAAEILMKSLYREIFRGKTPRQAVQAGRRELANNKQRRAAFNYKISLEDWLLPVVYQKQNVELRTKTLTPQEEEELLKERAEIGNMPEVEYGFHGRDVDILNIERRVLLKNNILLIRGMGGAGKTTLLLHLAWWWRATNFIKKVFYFGYDKKAYTRQEIMFEIAQNLYDKYEFAYFQALSEQNQQEKLAQKLRTERHLLILDNLESIQGGFFAVKNTLPPEEQARLKDFLVQLRGTDDAFVEQTIVLLGSRSAEEWLADRTFRKNLYDLNGLDPESATQFAEEILHQNDIPQSRKDDDFNKLLRLLAGFPLPTKVIFENLKRQSPTQILKALQAGDVILNAGSAEEKTQNILKCIEYSHSNIAPEKQELLLCLAPFTSVVNRIYFNDYIEELKKHQSLAHLRHELWDEVFHESIQRGLMSQQQDIPFFHLQPILPYFLKTEWQKAERSDFKQAVQTAFHDYYNQISVEINALLNSKDVNEIKMGQVLVDLEFENIETCLNYRLLAQTSVFNPCVVLSMYYNSIQNHQAGLDLGEKVLSRVENYSPEILATELGLEFANILYIIGRQHHSLKNYNEAELCCRKSLEFLHKQNMNEHTKKTSIATIYLMLGRIEFDRREWQKAEQNCHQALELNIELGYSDDQAKAYHLLGIILAEQKNFPKAEEYYKKALEIFNEINDINSMARIYVDLATSATEQGHFAEGEQHYLKALQIFEQFNDYYTQAFTLNHLGIVSQLQKKYSQAEYYYQQGLEISIAFNDRYSQADTFRNLGILKKEQGKLVEAEGYFLKSLEILRDFDDIRHLSITLSSLHRLWRESGSDRLLIKIAEILQGSEEEVLELFKKFSAEETKAPESAD